MVKSGAWRKCNSITKFNPIKIQSFDYSYIIIGCLAFIGISRPYFAITNKTRVQGEGSKIGNKFKN